MKLIESKTEHIYKDNKIVEYSDGTFIAYYYAKDDDSEDIQQFSANSLEEAKNHIDLYAK